MGGKKGAIAKKIERVDTQRMSETVKEPIEYITCNLTTISELNNRKKTSAA